LQRHGEVRLEHLVGEAMLNRSAIWGGAAVHGEVIFWGEGGLKKGKALNAVPLGVSEENVRFDSSGLLLKMLA